MCGAVPAGSSRESLSKRGEIFTQFLHHGAQKSTTVKPLLLMAAVNSDESEIFVNEASVLTANRGKLK